MTGSAKESIKIGERRATAEVGGFQQLRFILKMALGLICKYENDGCGTGMKFISF